MSTKVKTRIQNKYDTKENWAKASNFVPLKGELITVAPSTSEQGTATTIGTIPHRIKIGDGQRPIRELPYIGHPEVRYNSQQQSTLTGFSSVTLFSSGAVTLNLDLRQDSITSITNYEDREFIHHRAFISVDSRGTSKVTLNILGDGFNNTQDVLRASNVKISFVPSKCMLSSWHTGNTVSSNNYVLPEYHVTERATESSGTLNYTLSLPNDKNTQDDFLYNQGTFLVDITGFLFKDSNGDFRINLNIENSYLAQCTTIINTGATE